MAYCLKCKGNHQIAIENQFDEKPILHCSNCYQPFIFPEATSEQEFHKLAEEEYEKIKVELLKRWKLEMETAQSHYRPGLLSTKKDKFKFQDLISEGEKLINLLSTSRYRLERFLFIRTKQGRDSSIYPSPHMFPYKIDRQEFYRGQIYINMREAIRKNFVEEFPEAQIPKTEIPKDQDPKAQGPTAQFVEKIIAEAGLKNMPEDFKNDYMKKMNVEIEKRLGQMTEEELDEKGLDEYEKMFEPGKELDPEKVYDFLRRRIPDYDKKIISVLEAFGKEFKEGVAKMKIVADNVKD